VTRRPVLFVPNLTDEQVLAAMDLNNGAPMKYNAIVARLENVLPYDGHQLYRAVDPVLQRMKKHGKVELVRGPGAGWRRTFKQEDGQ
jgi:hypothetical protein